MNVCGCVWVGGGGGGGVVQNMQCAEYNYFPFKLALGTPFSLLAKQVEFLSFYSFFKDILEESFKVDRKGGIEGWYHAAEVHR